MKVRALKTFEGIKDLERDVFPKAGDEWEVSEERARVLKQYGVVEIIEDVKEAKVLEEVEEPVEELTEEKVEEVATIEEPVEYLSEPEIKEEKPKKKKRK